MVSLVPSLTETLLAWGIRPLACTRFCEQPGLPTVGGTKNPDTGAVVAYRPDLVLMDEEENRRQDYERLRDSGLAVHATAVRSLGDVEPTLDSLARHLRTVGFKMDRMNGLVSAEKPRDALTAPAPPNLRAFIPIWRRPWMALGAPTYGTSLLASLGVENVVVDRGPYPEVDLPEMAVAHPDVVLAPSEPYPFGKRQLPELATVAPVVFVDGKDLFWWGVRTGGASHRLALSLQEVLPDIGRRRAGGRRPPRSGI